MCTYNGKEKVIDWIDRTLDEGGKIMKDGRGPKVAGYETGYFLSPTIIENGHPHMPTAMEESFGPVAVLMRAASLDEALEWINSQNEHGHSACIFTQSGKTARKFTREADVGNIGINLAIPQPYAFFPLGSKKAIVPGRRQVSHWIPSLVHGREDSQCAVGLTPASGHFPRQSRCYARLLPRSPSIR